MTIRWGMVPKGGRNGGSPRLEPEVVVRMEHDWAGMRDLGIDISRVTMSQGFRGPVYKIHNDDGTWVEFCPEYGENEEQAGWIYAQYDSDGGVIGTGGGPLLSDIGGPVVGFTVEPTV